MLLVHHVTCRLYVGITKQKHRFQEDTKVLFGKYTNVVQGVC